MGKTMFMSAYLKVDRAEESLIEIDKLLSDSPPYSYAVETDCNTNKRATFAKKDELALNRLVIRCGELFHNLRSALDQAYWEAISPKVPETKYKAIQFPFAKDEESLEQTIKSRQGDKAGQPFFDALKNLNTHLGEGGNLWLALLHEVNIGDKHKFPIPTGDFTKLSSAIIKQRVPDFPGGISSCGFGMNRRDVTWPLSPFFPKTPKNLGDAVPSMEGIYHKVLGVPVETRFYVDRMQYGGEIKTTMQSLVAETKSALDKLASALAVTSESN